MNYKRWFLVSLAFLLAVTFAAPQINAQSIVTGAISGTVSDPSGAVIVGATVTLKSAATGEALTTNTSSTGLYQLTLLKPGQYTLTAEHSGFKVASQSVEVLLGQTTTINLKLSVGSGMTTVEVTAAGPLLQTEDANITSNFDTKIVENVPNPGGDITYVASLAPGVAQNNSSIGGFGNFSAFGLPGTANLFTINGNDYNDPFLNLNNSGSSNLLLGGNELQEVAVVVNGYTGQYGRQAGAQVDYSTKSGTNAYHGDAVYYWTGRALTANDALNKLGERGAGLPNEQPFYNNNQWAAAFGGPIKKDKAFFFVNTEGIRYVFGAVNHVFLPTPAFENFVLAGVPQDAGTQAFYNNVFSLYNGTKNAAAAVPQDNSCASVGALPGGSTQCLAELATASSNGNKEWLLAGRGDYIFSEKDKLFGRVKVDRGTQPTYTDPINPAFNAQSIQPQNDGQLNYTHVFSPTIVNNFIGSVLYYSALFHSKDINTALGLFPGNLLSTDSSLTALGSASGNPGGAAALFFYPQGRNVTQWQLVDDISIARGSHGFKMGVNFRRDDINDHTAGQITQYPLIETSLLGFATDQINVANLGGQVVENFAVTPKQPLANYSFGLYFQDEYRVNQKLKLTMTLRADRNSGGVCQTNCASLTTSPFDALAHDATIPYNQMVTPNRSSVLRDVEKVVFEPRFGFAWSPKGDNTVIRGGVGLFTDLYPSAILNLYTNNFPQVTKFNLPAGTVAFTTNPADFPGSGASLIGQCNSAFQSVFANGQTLADYAAQAPQCVDANGNQIVPNLQDTIGKVLNPKFVEWNAEVQHTIGRRTVVSLNYVGNRGYDIQLFNPDVNGFGFSGLPATAPDSRVANVTLLTNAGYSNYNGVTVSVQENPWHGLSGRFSYTYSHALDNVSNGGSEPYGVLTSILLQVNPFDPKASYGAADYDLRHSLNAFYVWDLPLKSSNRIIDAAIGGWQVSGTAFWHSAFPFSVLDTATSAGLAAQNLANVQILAQPVSGFTQRNFSNGALCAVQQCFTGADFEPATGFSGSIPRNGFRGPGYFNTDVSIRKNFKLNERLGFQVGASAYNVLNHANYGVPFPQTAGPTGLTLFMTNPPTSPYGAFASAAIDERIVQVIGKFTF